MQGKRAENIEQLIWKEWGGGDWWCANLGKADSGCDWQKVPRKQLRKGSRCL